MLLNRKFKVCLGTLIFNIHISKASIKAGNTCRNIKCIVTSIEVCLDTIEGIQETRTGNQRVLGISKQTNRDTFENCKSEPLERRGKTRTGHKSQGALGFLKQQIVLHVTEVKKTSDFNNQQTLLPFSTLG